MIFHYYQKNEFMSYVWVMIMSYKIEIYTKKNCPYCNKAKAFFIKKSLNFEEISVDDGPLSSSKYLEMLNRSQGRFTVPQIFINDYHVGGSDDLMKMNDNSETLNILLNDKSIKNK